MLHKEIPFLRIGLPLCAGIISGLYVKPDPFILLLISIIAITGFLLSLYFNKYRTNLAFGFSMTIALYICGLLLYINEKSSLSTLEPERSVFKCTLSDYPEEKENSYMLTVDLSLRISQVGQEKVRGSLILYNKKDSIMRTLLPGDKMVIKCTPVEITNKGNPYEFNYKFYMENHGIKYYAFTSGADILSHNIPARRKLIHRALIIREGIIDMYKNRGITGEKLAIVAAVTLGQKNMLDPEQKQNFIRAGVMHIMAVSGLHALILSLFVFNLLFFLKGRFNILRIIISILILWTFAFVTGLPSSVLRAALMFTFLQAGNLMQRRVNGINSILASAFVLILIRPSVIFDAGFLLSYSAVIYIVTFYHNFYLKLQLKNLLADKIWQSIVVTIVAQLGTLPLTIMLFNRFPAYFILTNIVIVPIASVLIVTGCLIPLLYPLKFISFMVAKLLNSVTGLTENITAKASALPGSTIENIGMTPVECILLTITIFLFCYTIFKRQSISLLYPFGILILLASAVTVIEISIRQTNELIVYNTPGATTIGIRTGKILNVYSDTIVARPEAIRHCATLGLKMKTNLISQKPCFIMAAGEKILICSSTENIVTNGAIPAIVIITGSKYQIINQFMTDIHPESIVYSSAAPFRYNLQQQDGLKMTDTVHFVRRSGAFIKRI